MKFRFVDRILALGNDSIQTEKAISFEEYSLLKPWGRKGAFPESLILQVAVDSAVFLAVRRSSGTCVAILEEAEAVRFERETRPGDVLRCRVNVEMSSYAFEITTNAGPLATGRIRLRELPLTDCFEAEAYDLMRDALHAPARS